MADPGRHGGRHRAPDSQDGQKVTGTGTGGRHRVLEPAQALGAADEEEELIVGIADAARYLGYDKPDSFRRARTRHPIPGETKTGDGRPCWTPRVLRSWQSTRKIAGNRPHSGSHD